MAYTEVKERNRRKYYYRVLSVRNREKINKKRIYLGANLNQKTLEHKEAEADNQIIKERINKNLDKFKKVVIKILKKYNVKKASFFGSYVRGEQKKDSDIDIIIEYPNGLGFKFAGIVMELEEKLGKKIDLLTYKGVSPYIKKNILNEEVRII